MLKYYYFKVLKFFLNVNVKIKWRIIKMLILMLNLTCYIWKSCWLLDTIRCMQVLIVVVCVSLCGDRLLVGIY
jgi:hypothetical protein